MVIVVYIIVQSTGTDIDNLGAKALHRNTSLSVRTTANIIRNIDCGGGVALT